MSETLKDLAKRYESADNLPDTETRIQDARELKAAGYVIQHAFLASGTIEAPMMSLSHGPTLLDDEVKNWRATKQEGIVGPYVDMYDADKEPFVPKVALAYWQLPPRN